MIVCHCNCIMAVAIEQSARELDAGAAAPPTPEEVYRALGMKPCCGGCLPLAEVIISAALPTRGSPLIAEVMLIAAE
jgi:bacterioferritin-associated ferredoxin